MNPISSPEQRWLSIESAPKDGTPFLAYREFHCLPAKAPTFMAVIAWLVTKLSPEGAWVLADGNYKGLDYGPQWTWADPTHWMPLPSPPEAGQ